MLSDQLRSALNGRQGKKTLRKLTFYPTIPHQHSNFVASSDSEEDQLGPESKREPQSTSSSSSSVTQDLIDFSSNDYLSISTSPTLYALFAEKIRKDMDQGNRLGSSGSRLLDGNSNHHLQLESLLCSQFHSPASLLFNSGYEANVSIFSTLPQPKDLIIYDSLIHASVHDGIRTSRTDKRLRFSFKHNDLKDFEETLRALVDPEDFDAKIDSSSSSKPHNLTLGEKISISQDFAEGKRNVFLALESIYSMDGDFCLLKDFLDLFEKYFPKRGNRFVVVDEAHSTGVYGGSETSPSSSSASASLDLTQPSDLVEGFRAFDSREESRRNPPGEPNHVGGAEGFTFQEKELDRVDIRLVTFGKAVGAVGAAALCQPLVREYLINYARPLIFSTSLPLPNIHLISSSLKILFSNEGELRRRYLYESTRFVLNSLCQFIPIISDEDATSTSNEPSYLLALPSTLFPSSSSSSSSSSTIKSTFNSSQTPFKPSPIIPILSRKSKDLSQHLISKGYLVRSITYPTVPRGKDRIRICLHSGNRRTEIEGLVKELRNWFEDQKRSETRNSAEADDQNGHGAGKGLSSKL